MKPPSLPPSIPLRSLSSFFNSNSFLQAFLFPCLHITCTTCYPLLKWHRQGASCPSPVLILYDSKEKARVRELLIGAQFMEFTGAPEETDEFLGVLYPTADGRTSQLCSDLGRNKKKSKLLSPQLACSKMLVWNTNDIMAWVRERGLICVWCIKLVLGDFHWFDKGM